MSAPSEIIWGLYSPFVVHKLAREYGYSLEQAEALVAGRCAVAQHALRDILFRPRELPAHVVAAIRRAKPETKIAAGVAAGVFGLGLTGLLVWFLRKK